MFRLIAINFSQKSPHISLLFPTYLCELSEREVTSPSNLKVVGALVLYMHIKIIYSIHPHVCHDIAEILLKLALNTNQSIILM